MAKPSKLLSRKSRHNRIRARVIGTAVRPRLVVYRSLKFNYACLVNDASGKTILSASDQKVKKKGVKKVDAAKLVGIEIAKKALEKNMKSCVFDRAGYKFHGRVKALAEGAREGGLQF